MPLPSFWIILPCEIPASLVAPETPDLASTADATSGASILVGKREMLFPATASTQRVQSHSLGMSKNLAKMKRTTYDAHRVAISRVSVFREARLYGGPEVAVTTERLDDAPATGTVWPNFRSGPVQVRKPKALGANKRENVLTAKWNPACIHPMIEAKYTSSRVGSIGAFNHF